VPGDAEQNDKGARGKTAVVVPDTSVAPRVSSRHAQHSPDEPEAVITTRWNRRQFITTTAATLAGGGLLPRGAAAQAGPWAQRPPGNPGSVNFVVWQYGKIYEQIAKQFEDDWGVKVQQIIEPNVEPQVAKLTAMFAANEPVDVSQSPMQYLASYIEQGIAQPIDGLPGVEQYIRDFTPFTRAIAQRDGKTWGLPYFSTVWTFMYNDELLAKAGSSRVPGSA
jgi:multiple sugar transport system substrate-binding protein